MKRLCLLIVSLVLVLLLIPSLALAKPAPPPTFDQAIDQLFAQGYPQNIDAKIAAMGTNPVLGFRWAGSRADNQAANYIAAQLRAAGLTNVHLEAVPTDVFNFLSASVTAGSRTMVASSFAGIRPTPPKGVTAQVVYAHSGTKQDFDALQAAGVSVAGKLVIIDADFNSWWCNDPAAEATARGAIGEIFTYGPPTDGYYNYKPDALGSFDSQFDMTTSPAVYISMQDGAWLKGQLDANGVGPVVTMKLVEQVRLADDGGVGYNVFGDIPGSVNDGSFVLFDAHHDAHFHSAADDTVGCVNNLAIAKAMMMSHYKPTYTMRFMFVTGEEFGYTNCYNDWCTGAWFAIDQAHPDWAGRLRGFINNDQTGGVGTFNMVSTPEFMPYLNALGAAAGSALPGGYNVSTPNSTWNDSWTFTAAGVQAVTVSSGSFPHSAYHTQYMTADWLNWPGIAQGAKFMFRIADGLTQGQLPYDLKTRADEVAANVSAPSLLLAGADAGAVTRLENDISAFQSAAAAYQARSIPPAHYADVNQSLLQIEKTLGVTFTGQNVWQMMIYPHQQVLLDLQSLEQAIADLQLATPDRTGAMAALSNVGLASVGLRVDDAVYRHLLTRLDPTYYRAVWGDQGHALTTAELLDIVPQYDAIQLGTWDSQTIAQLQAMVASDVVGLNTRLDAMSAALEQVIPQINALN
jgi:Peptidase family M28